MSHLTVQRHGKAYHVPLATVQDVIDLMDANYAKKRVELLADLDDMNASEETKLKAMAEIRERKGMTTDLIREAFTLPGARSIIQHVAKTEDHAAILEDAPDQIVQVALQVLGFTVDEQNSEEDGERPENPPKGDATSTTKP